MLQEKSKTVQDFKVETADRYTLGMAINNAAVIFPRKNYYNDSDIMYMKELITKLFELYKKTRQEILGY